MNFSAVKTALKKNKILNSAVFFDSIGSTSQYLKDNDFATGTVVAAAKQTAGRGKHGAGWVSGEGGLWFSYVINKKIQKPYIFVILSSVAVAQALKEAGIEPVIKWPNDIMAREKKISGMLIENDAYNSKLVTGIGINVNNDTPEGHGINAVSMKDLAGEKVDAGALLISIVKKIDSYISRLPAVKKKLIASWVKYQGHIGGTVISLNRGNKKMSFEVIRTLNSGELKVKDGRGKTRLLSGEVFFK
jgi:BirA family biotin operon repressor/biotin-[acetyl-CoA-carboxylase] ligase